MSVYLLDKSKLWILCKRNGEGILIPSGKSPSVLVIGGGVAGIQASLDLAQAGFSVVLIERSPLLGGTMARLEKIFPARECSLCLLSPKMVELKRQANIRVITMATLDKLAGTPGNFIATVQSDPVYVDANLCNGCGLCAANCPVPSILDQYGSHSRAVWAPPPGALPGAYVINAGRCLHLGEGANVFGPGLRCGVCAKICPVAAVDFGRRREIHVLEVGAVILTTGFEHFDPEELAQYHWGELPGVLTGLEFEQLMVSAADDSLRWPGDQRKVRRIAWIQCVGSRNEKIGSGYCSAVCCLNSAKEATMVRERWPETECSVFYTDLRACGPDSEQAFAAAREAGVRYERCRIGEVSSADLRLRYVRSDLEVAEEAFDLVVLAVGLRASRETMQLAEKLGLTMNRWGFCEEQGISGRPGIYPAGGCCGPADIAASVTGGSAAAAAAAVFLSGVRPPPAVFAPDVAVRGLPDEPARVGVFVCHCGSNIGGVVDVAAVTAQAGDLEAVVYARDLRYACSEEGQEIIRKATEDLNLNRVVVAACTPLYHERVFAANLQMTGLNPSLLEMANIREHCSWVHRTDRPGATAKASAIVRRAVARAKLLEPLPIVEVKVQKRALVIGGGAAGLSAALDLAGQGIPVYLVEKGERLGGRAMEPGICPVGVQKDVAGLVERVERHSCVEVYSAAVLRSVSGHTGDFTAVLDLAGGGEVTLSYGVAVIAAGGREADPADYLYGRHKRVVTVSQAAGALERGSIRLQAGSSIALILCAGSRDAQIPYCSMVCCQQALELVQAILGKLPGVRIFVFYRDIRTPSFSEEVYRRTRAAGVVFIPYNPDEAPLVEANGKSLRVSAREPYLDADLLLDVEWLILAPPVIPAVDAGELAGLFKTPLNRDGFFQAAHGKLLPVDLAIEGVFVAGSVHGPRSTAESITEGRAAAARAMRVLSRDTWRMVEASAYIREDLCSGCGVCLPLCPFKAISFDAAKRVAVIEPWRCKGCGVCAAACPQRACLLPNWTQEQVLAEIAALCGEFGR